MIRILKNKFFRAVVFIALLATIAVTVLGLMGVESPLGHVTGLVTTPVRKLASAVARGIGGFGIYFERVEELKEENFELKKELSSLKNELAAAREKIEDDEFLRKFIGDTQNELKYNGVTATVIGRQDESYNMLLTLNKGSLHGVEKNMVVVTSDGVVGYVSSVGATYCYVNPIINPDSSVGVCSMRTGDDGMIVGDMKIRADMMCYMKYIDADADIKEGDILVTTGTGKIYPGGLNVGEVCEVLPDDINRSVTVKVRTSVDFQNLDRVLIVKDIETTSVTNGGEAE